MTEEELEVAFQEYLEFHRLTKAPRVLKKILFKQFCDYQNKKEVEQTKEKLRKDNNMNIRGVNVCI